MSKSVDGRRGGATFTEVGGTNHGERSEPENFFVVPPKGGTNIILRHPTGGTKSLQKLPVG